MLKPKYVLLSFSGGKDSTAMLLRMLELNEQVDEVVCCDTGKEFPQMLDHIAKIKTMVEEKGITFTILKAEYSFDYYMFEYEPKRKNEALKDKKGYSWPGPLTRWCTGRLKTELVDNYRKILENLYEVEQCVGIATDEEYRLERKQNKKEGVRYPLVEWGWSEYQCLEYCYSQGYDWDGLYNIFQVKRGESSRVSCWCCPLQSLEDLRTLRKHFPGLWEELRDMDKRTWRKFRKDYTVEELEIRFSLEDELLAERQSIHNRKFFAKLKERLNEAQQKNEED